MKVEFRTLRAEEIEVRVGSVGQYGVTLLLYKDARCDMNLLDEVVGPTNWKREHSRDNANCTVSIWDDEKNQWVSKEDTGTVSYTEAEKGLASDSFKRACVNWGIGRELYSAPFMFVNCPTQGKQNGRGWELCDRYQFSDAKVTEIQYDDKRNIIALAVCDKNGMEIFREWPKRPNKAQNIAKTEEQIMQELKQASAEEAHGEPPKMPEKTAREEVDKRLREVTEEERAELLEMIEPRQVKNITEFAKSLDCPLERMVKAYGKDRVEDLNKAEYVNAINRLMQLEDKREKKKKNVVKEG